MRRNRWSLAIPAAALACSLQACGSDGGPEPEELNLEEQQISATGQASSADMNADGRFVVTWTEVPGGFRMQRFTQDGFKDGPAINVASEGLGGWGTAAFGSQGQIRAVWTTLSGVVTRLYAPDGSPLGGEIQVRGRAGLVAMDVGAGGQGVVLSQGLDPRIVATRLSADGSPAGPEVVVGSGDPGTVCCSTAVLPDGSFVVARSRPGQVQLQRFASDGAPAGARIDVGTADPFFPPGPRVEAAPGAGFVAVWKNADSSVEGQRFAADGSPVGGRFTAGVGNSWSFFVGPEGSMVFAWDDGRDLFAQRMAADGTPQGPRIPVAVASGTGYLSVASVVLGPSGRFFVTWGGNNFSGLRGRLFAE
jgi:hypothetical protein